MTTVNASRTDFEGLLRSLREYLGSQREIQDYDYESSAVSTLLGVLAAVGNIKAINANFVSAEGYLTTAQLRKNVVAKASDLGYSPRSARGATAVLNLRVSSNGATNSIPKNSQFIATLEGENIPFVLPEDLTIPGSGQRNRIINDVTIVQGTPLTHRFTVEDGTRYILPNLLSDEQSLSVREITTDGIAVSVYQHETDIAELTQESKAFFSKENENELLEIYFGDGTISAKPALGNIVEVSYRVTIGSKGNGLRSFSPPNVSGLTIEILSVETPSEGGDDGEDIESIRNNAPKTRRARGKLITPEDYETVITHNFGDISDVKVWRGIDNDPPDTGAVYLSIQPASNDFLSRKREREIAEYLNIRAVPNARHIFTRPAHLFVAPEIIVHYDPSLTILNAGDLLEKIRLATVQFEQDNFRKFGRTFVHSNFVRTILEADASIASVTPTIKIQRKILPTSNIKYYNVPFNNPIYNPQPGFAGVINSSTFEYNEITNAQIRDDGYGTLVVYHLLNGERRILNSNIGSIHYPKGIAVLHDFLTRSNEITLIAQPENNNIQTSREMVLFMANVEIFVINDTNNKVEATLKGAGTEGDNIIADDDFYTNSIF